ncbi:hypothetical protein D5018_10420 [Parashewanella curva]|uniref:Uncharacterized protein n=1 Tax=Parashewanella curva TaxID=2338552 RepID=A0A3L8PWN1_9GAMM|nr:hypothetical protein [Parashewanella curva]RLV59774.1 hypothetical protein D5018_10420 [Parashewanella curva]
MSNSINVNRSEQVTSSEHESKDKKADPQSREVRHFKELFNPFHHKQDEFEMDDSKNKNITKTTKSILSHDGGVCKLGGAEVSRQGDMLCYRMLNGPMTGLIIQANYDKRGIRLSLHPKNERQAKAINNAMPKIVENLKGRKHHVHINVQASRE